MNQNHLVKRNLVGTNQIKANNVPRTDN